MTKKGPSRKGKRIPPPPRDPVEREELVIERVEDRPSGGGKKKKRASGRRKIDVTGVQIHGVAGQTAAKLQRRLAEAAAAFEAERFADAERLLDSIDRLAPDVAEVHELRGLTNYRLARWGKAIRDLERFHELTRSTEQHPVLADCNRAMKRWTRAEELWHELGQASPAPELIEEGRIVQAGVLADRGRLNDAIRFMERAPKVKGKPGIHHLRRWYVMADLYERAGDNSRARRLFADVAKAEPDFGDAAERAANL